MHRTLLAANELALPRRRRLEVKASQRTAPGVPGDVGLDHRDRKAVRCELTGAPAPGEEAPFIFVSLELDFESAGQRCCDEAHSSGPKEVVVYLPGRLQVLELLETREGPELVDLSTHLDTIEQLPELARAVPGRVAAGEAR